MAQDELKLSKGHCLITVGTTQFDELIQCLEGSAESFCKELSRRGVRRLVIQTGKTEVSTKNLKEVGLACGIHVQTFPYVPSLDKLVQTASFVISHAGAGTILEVCRAQKSLIVVVNEKLMHNHQLELATALAARDHLIWSTVDNLLQTLEVAEFGDLVPMQPSQPQRLADLVDHEMR